MVPVYIPSNPDSPRCKWQLEDAFPIGFRPIFRGEPLVSGRVE